MLATSPFGASSNIALWRAKIKPPVELVVGDLCELKTIEQLLSNRINADYDPDIDRLLCKIRKEINDINHKINRTIKWAAKEQ